MAQSTFSIRMDEKLKDEFEELCTQFGMNITTAINVFARAVVREKKIPFEIKASNESSLFSARQAFFSLRENAQKTDLADMSMDEIDEEINNARNGK